MSTARQSILLTIFGPYVKADKASMDKYGTEENLKKSVMASIQQATAAGFELGSIAINPADPDDSIRRLEEELRGRQWNGLLVGYAIRGSKDHTVLYERAVNTAKDVAPGTSLLFGTAPDDLMTTLQRNFAIA